MCMLIFSYFIVGFGTTERIKFEYLALDTTNEKESSDACGTMITKSGYENKLTMFEAMASESIRLKVEKA